MIIFSIIGTLIGAGFASGQEMYLFFYRFGIYGMLGLALCSILIGLVIYKTFIIIYNSKSSSATEIHNYHDFLNAIFYKNGKKPKNKYLNLSYISNIIINIFLLVTFYIMISGFGAYFEQEFEMSKIIGALILSIVCFIILVKDISGVTKANSVVVPILIVVVLSIGARSLVDVDLSNISREVDHNWILQSIIYCSYNMILVIPVLVELSRYIKSKKQILAISVLTSIIVFILAISVFLLLTITDTDFAGVELPAVYAISQAFPALRIIYGVAILLSIFSTAISIGISFLGNVTENKKNYAKIAAVMCISGLLVSNIGFSNLVRILFPVFGYLGILQILFILKKLKKS